MKPAVITSRVAQKDYDSIVAKHSDILTGMANQSLKVAAYNQQKGTEMQNKENMKFEMEREKMAANTEAQKNAMNFSIKQSELDIKRAALSAA